MQRMMISRYGKAYNTAPERRFDDYQRSRNLGLVMNHTLPFVAENHQGVPQRYDFQMDFLRPIKLSATGATWDVDLEIDGKGHKEKNDEWKDTMKASHGLKTIHIPGILTEKKYWWVLDRDLPNALLSKDSVVYLVA